MAVHAILQRAEVLADRDLQRQISEANDSITANMREGFEQKTDALFANYLHYSKGSIAEVLDRLESAHRKGLVTDKELATLLETGDEVCRMLGGFIKYLEHSNFKHRGSHASRRHPRRPPRPPVRSRRSG